MKIPENEIQIKFIRSSGRGGQNVNRRATKAQLRWNINKSQVLTDVQKELIFQRLPHLITKDGDIILESQKERSQVQNRRDVIARLNHLITLSLKPRKKRIPTKPSKAVKKRWLKEKHIISEKKKARRRIKFLEE